MLNILRFRDLRIRIYIFDVTAMWSKLRKSLFVIRDVLEKLIQTHIIYIIATFNTNTLHYTQHFAF